MAADLRELRQGVDIAQYNMSQVASSPELLAPQGPFADDRHLAQNFLARLDDELRYLDIAAERASEATDLIAGQENGPAPVASPAGKPSVRRLAAPRLMTSQGTYSSSTAGTSRHAPHCSASSERWGCIRLAGRRSSPRLAVPPLTCGMSSCRVLRWLRLRWS